jgi:DNA-binding XRE family transcriptional regulator
VKPMAKNFSELRKKMSPQARARSEAAAKKMIREFPLKELRDAQNITQVELARRLKIDQSAISKIEHRADMYLSTLSDVVAAMGGHLEINARFPSGDVHVLALAKAAPQQNSNPNASSQRGTRRRRPARSKHA